MSMNSFSLRIAQQKHREYEEEISELLQLHPEGEVFSLRSRKTGTMVSYRPVDFSELKDDWADSVEDQSAPRVEAKLTVLIANHKKAFRTQTVDLSLAGLKLKDFLPKEFLNHIFDIVLVQTLPNMKKTFCLFRGKAVGRGPRFRQIRFESITSESSNQLRRLLETLSR